MTATSRQAPELGLGTMTFGVETPEAEAHAQLDRFVAAGGRLLDTADVYGGGDAERIVGSWLAATSPPADLQIATKSRFGPGDVNGASGPALRTAIAASHERLGIGRSDIHLVHGWDQDTPVEETLEALTELVEAGTVAEVGWSNATGWQLSRLITTARLRGYVVPTRLQLQYSLVDRAIEWELLPCAIEEGLTVMAWGPLGGGWLTGKYRRDARPTGATRLGENPDRGVEGYDVRNTDRTWAIIDVLTEIAERLDRSPGEVAVAWLLGRPAMSSVLLGARTDAQLAQILGAGEISLGDDDRAALTEVSAPGLPDYPYRMLQTYCDIPHWLDLGAEPTASS